MKVYRWTDGDVITGLERAQAIGRQGRRTLITCVNLYFWRSGACTVEVVGSKEQANYWLTPSHWFLHKWTTPVVSDEILSVEDEQLAGYYLGDGDALAELMLGLKVEVL